jgi:hypothetical protein
MTTQEIIDAANEMEAAIQRWLKLRLQHEQAALASVGARTTLDYKQLSPNGFGIPHLWPWAISPQPSPWFAANPQETAFYETVIDQIQLQIKNLHNLVEYYAQQKQKLEREPA